MRQALLEELTKLMYEDPSVFLVTTDTGFHVFDEFQKQFAARYLNVGISEAAMIGMAAGMALEGRKVFVYGIVPFVTLRCLEQIRVDLCYMPSPVKIIGVGGGLTYGPAGGTHHSIEDIAVLCALPNMTVLCPGDPGEVRGALRASLALSGPCYLRIGKSGEERVHPGPLPCFEIGRAIRVRDGSGIGLIATGNMLPTAARVRERLAAQGLQPALLSMHTVKPIDVEAIRSLAGHCRLLVTIEEHNIIGGLGAMVGGVLADENLPNTLLRCGIPDVYACKAGSQDFLRQEYGLTPEALTRRILNRWVQPVNRGLTL